MNEMGGNGKILGILHKKIDLECASIFCFCLRSEKLLKVVQLFRLQQKHFVFNRNSTDYVSLYSVTVCTEFKLS